MKKIKIEVRCNNEVGKDENSEPIKCANKLMDSKTMTPNDLKKNWTLMVASAPLNTPRCDKCKYSTWSDCNAGTDFFIGNKKHGYVTSKQWWEKNKTK